MNLSSFLDKIRTSGQPQPTFQSPIVADPFFWRVCELLLPPEYAQEVRRDLEEISRAAAEELSQFSEQAERDPPRLVQFNAVGNRIDQLLLSEGWKRHKAESARLGIVALGYERQFEKYQRLVQFMRLVLYSASSGMFGCPLAMTDGAARVLLGLKKSQSPFFTKEMDEALEHFISRDPTRIWTSGQWMTEKRGGSDVRNSTETIAFHTKDNEYRLFGFKWFTSATDSEIALVLARIQENEQEINLQAPLSLFFVNVRNSKGELNNIEIVRLKDKLGTRQLPTAELFLKGTQATLISEKGQGVKAISDMMNVTRLYNSAHAVSSMQKILILAKDFASKRVVFGKAAIEQSLHRRTLSDLEVAYRGNLLFLLKMSQLYGFSESSSKETIAQETALFRLMIPVLKLYTAKEGIRVVSEGIECFGGLGYIESSNIPTILRDVLVTSIWEGTTNVLCYDLLRVLRSPDGRTYFEIFASYIRLKLSILIYTHSQLDKIKPFVESVNVVTRALGELQDFAMDLIEAEKITPIEERRLREVAYMFANVFIAGELIELAFRSALEVDRETFNRWVELNKWTFQTKMKPEGDEILVDVPKAIPRL
eukprot:TRINITY_DN8610_c0_g2_i4.p1 TRINITY_DN8610_c0_g2~~TRINITY_DN8610_c0_g2_i4.p1  ORF type:complete len:596 (-),score=150.99 TRINITY_DN8610_c0_g2_i4:986-2773(-)